jgi:hypothetical protein
MTKYSTLSGSLPTTLVYTFDFAGNKLILLYNNNNIYSFIEEIRNGRREKRKDRR